VGGGCVQHEGPAGEDGNRMGLGLGLGWGDHGGGTVAGAGVCWSNEARWREGYAGVTHRTGFEVRTATRGEDACHGPFSGRDLSDRGHGMLPACDRLPKVVGLTRWPLPGAS
jgi:hypothetical protein